MKTFFASAVAAVMLAGAVSAPAAHAADPTFQLTIRNHLFQPDTLTIPADTKVVLEVINEDATPEEFESHDLNREKVIAGKSKGIVVIGPLKPGTYSFVGEFHEDTAKGRIVVK
tara:strand:+ start:437 stop:778 length:342 start_codon:yes stop_codon:yes gene_type:complete